MKKISSTTVCDLFSPVHSGEENLLLNPLKFLEAYEISKLGSLAITVDEIFFTQKRDNYTNKVLFRSTPLFFSKLVFKLKRNFMKKKTKIWIETQDAGFYSNNDGKSELFCSFLLSISSLIWGVLCRGIVHNTFCLVFT